MNTFVLVHGAWHGGWCWRHLVPLLRARGHEVHHPTLTGLGERSHLRGPVGTGLGLDTHVEDVLAVLEYEDLREVVLVGHSYGGMVVTGVADRAADRLQHLVYLDAWLPHDGESLFDLMRPERRDSFRERARQHGGLVPSPPPQLFGVTAPPTVDWLAARLGPQPVRTFEQPLVLRSPPEVISLPRTYIRCTEGPLVSIFDPFAARARATSGWRYEELRTGHDAMVTAPHELASALPSSSPMPPSVTKSILDDE
jgi:pimeloyl-ACP methyl ester carboxylesterase